MGQYYMPCSIEKNQSVYSHDYDNGLKLLEHSWVGNNFVNVVERLIAEGGAWFGDRIVWAGDYAEPEKDENGNPLQIEIEGDKFYLTLYRKVRENNIKPTFVGKSPKYRYVINMDTKEFVDIKKVPHDGDDWQIHPLPLLTCEGNGNGNGDFFGEDPNNLIGKWARNRVTVSTRKPKKHKELIFDLVY